MLTQITSGLGVITHTDLAPGSMSMLIRLALYRLVTKSQFKRVQLGYDAIEPCLALSS